MPIVDKEEFSNKCYICSSGLSMIEIVLYGNRCIFCSEIKPLSFFRTLQDFLFHYHVYLLSIELKRKYKNDSRMYFYGALGVCGVTDINMLSLPSDKNKFIRELRILAKNKG